MRLIVAWSLVAVAFIAIMFAAVGTIGPMQPDDRDVPGATTGKGKSKLID